MIKQEHFETERKGWAFFSVALFISCFILSSLIPPLQSPDEFDHIKRIFFLTNGQIFLETPANQSSGGMIDSGLAEFIKAYGKVKSKPDIKLTRAALDEANGIKWTGTKVFSSASGTGYYFPLIYAPQAIGLATGEALGLTVEKSYKLARFSVLIASCLLLIAAFRVYRPPVFAAALLVLPMSLFQFSSASLDGISTALFILAVSCFARISIDRTSSKSFLPYVLIVCTALVSSSRAHALPIFLLVFASSYYVRSKKVMLCGIAALVLVIGWLALAISLTHSTQFTNAPPTSSIIMYYLQDPISLIRVFYRTLDSAPQLTFYAQSFVGILGWLDARFPNWYYNLSYVFCLILMATSAAHRDFKHMWGSRLLLLACAAGSTALIFFALLIQWNANEHPAEVIQGVQGRYLLLPALLIAYSIGSERQESYRPVHWIGVSILGAYFLFSIYGTTDLLISRYFLATQ